MKDCLIYIYTPNLLNSREVIVKISEEEIQFMLQVSMTCIFRAIQESQNLLFKPAHWYFTPVMGEQ